jgi:hypothetical protein
MNNCRRPAQIHPLPSPPAFIPPRRYGTLMRAAGGIGRLSRREDGCVRINPLLRPIAQAVYGLTERWADEIAAERIGDRRQLASALTRAAEVTRNRRMSGTHLDFGSLTVADRGRPCRGAGSRPPAPVMVASCGSVPVRRRHRVRDVPRLQQPRPRLRRGSIRRRDPSLTTARSPERRCDRPSDGAIAQATARSPERRSEHTNDEALLAPGRWDAGQISRRTISSNSPVAFTSAARMHTPATSVRNVVARSADAGGRCRAATRSTVPRWLNPSAT